MDNSGLLLLLLSLLSIQKVFMQAAVQRETVSGNNKATCHGVGSIFKV